MIGELNVALNTFNVKFDLDLCWKATKEDITNFGENEESDFTPTFVPNLVLLNSFLLEFDEIITLSGNIKKVESKFNTYSLGP